VAAARVPTTVTASVRSNRPYLLDLAAFGTRSLLDHNVLVELSGSLGVSGGGAVSEGANETKE
jgi:hypothetical protein